MTVLNFYFTFTDLTIYSKFLSFLTVNTFTKHSYQKLQTVQFVKCTHGSERKHLVLASACLHQNHKELG